MSPDRGTRGGSGLARAGPSRSLASATRDVIDRSQYQNMKSRLKWYANAFLAYVVPTVTIGAIFGLTVDNSEPLKVVMGVVAIVLSLGLGVIVGAQSARHVDAHRRALVRKALADTHDVVSTATGPLMTHHVNDCAGPNCCTHNPSDHPLRDAPLNWRGHVMERLCPHGIGHPDPDDLAYRRSTGREAHGTHGCDGCCVPTSTTRDDDE